MWDNFRWPFFFSILIFIFSYSNYIILYRIFCSLIYNPDSGTEFIPNTLRLWEKWRIFYFTFILYPYWVFVKRDKCLSQLIKFKYDNIKFKKSGSGTCLTSKLYDKIIKTPSKSHETIPSNRVRRSLSFNQLKLFIQYTSSYWIIQRWLRISMLPFNHTEFKKCISLWITSVKTYFLVEKIRTLR
jgi:hypothetical protein